MTAIQLSDEVTLYWYLRESEEELYAFESYSLQSQGFLHSCLLDRYSAVSVPTEDGIPVYL